MIRRHIRKVARFDSVRRGYSWLEGCRQWLFPRPSQWPSEGLSSLFPDLDIRGMIQELRQVGVVTGLQLPLSIVDVIRGYALQTRCFLPSDAETTFQLSRVVQGNGLIPRAFVCNPESCAAVQQIIDDHHLNSVAHQYLGYVPNRVKATLIWSIASEASVGESNRGHRYDAARYHYDTNGYNSLQVLFYLTDVDRSSGAHAVIRESHRTKPLSMKLRSSIRIQEAELLAFFGPQPELIVEGDKGAGLIEDPACFHRIIPPTASNRLALRLVYS